MRTSALRVSSVSAALCGRRSLHCSGAASAEHLSTLLEANKRWRQKMLEKDPQYFENLAKGQSPKYFWIGCADSRVPESVITESESGDIFVHRNAGNVLPHGDVNWQSALHIAVDYAKVSDIMVVGHYGCAAVAGAISGNSLGFSDDWVRPIQDVFDAHRAEFEGLSQEEKEKKLVRLNVKQGVKTVSRNRMVQAVWEEEERELRVHGLVYSIGTGELIDLNCTRNSVEHVEKFV